MVNAALKDTLMRLLPRVQTPAQYMGGELNAVVKDHRAVRGTLCLAFPDTYALGTSHHGLQVLYSIMNADPQWACERAFAPWLDFERLLREHGLPLYSLETFTPLRRFDVIGFSLQYEVWEMGRCVGRVDGAVPKLKLAIEMDGYEHHTDPDTFQRDRSRQNELVALGWTVLRFTWHDVVNRPAEDLSRGRVFDALEQTRGFIGKSDPGYLLLHGSAPNFLADSPAVIFELRPWRTSCWMVGTRYLSRVGHRTVQGYGGP